MSKRRRPDPKQAPRPDPRQAARPDRMPAAPPDGRGQGRLLRDLLILAVAFGAGVGVAELAGAANLGVAFGVGQVVFAIALVVLLTRD